MLGEFKTARDLRDCRTGSSEIVANSRQIGEQRDCRTGSSEKLQDLVALQLARDCRTGSSETIPSGRADSRGS